MNDKEIIEVVQARIQGKRIEYRPRLDTPHAGAWYEYQPGSGFEWAFDRFDYRVAPEHRKPREWWTTIARLVGAEHASGDTCLPIKVREVIE